MANEKDIVKDGKADPARSLNSRIQVAEVTVTISGGSGSTTYSHDFEVEPKVFVSKPIDGDVDVSNKGSSQFDVSISGTSAGDGDVVLEVLMLRA